MTSRLPTIFILEDDDAMHSVYLECLTPAYEVAIFSEISAFHDKMRELPQSPQRLALLDLSLKEGFLWDHIDTSLLTMPFMIISGTDNLATLRDCYAKGAVDYLLKPVRTSEIIVKIENFFRRQQPCGCTGNRLDHVVLDLSNMTLKAGSVDEVSLTPKEMRIVGLLLKEPCEGVGKLELFEQVWGSDRVKVNPKTLDIHMYNLRRKIRHAGLDIDIAEDGHYRLRPCP